jgi:molybdate transport system regulatory protein
MLSSRDDVSIASFKIGENRLQICTKFWLETDKGYVFGEGPFQLLLEIAEKGTLSEAARDLRMSYRHAWGVLRETGEKMGISLLTTHKGGSKGGGGAELTSEAMELVDRYSQLKKAYVNTMSDLIDKPAREALSLGGELRGTMIEIKETNRIKIARLRIEPGSTFSILVESADIETRGIKKGDKVGIEVKDQLLTLKKL